jgi:hypothetical protein
MNYAFKMRLGAIIYVSNFINIGSDIKKLIACDTHTNTRIHRHTPTDRKVIL